MGGLSGGNGSTPKVCNIVDVRRATNCLIMLSRIKMDYDEIRSNVLELDGLSLEQVRNESTKDYNCRACNLPGSSYMLYEVDSAHNHLCSIPLNR